MYEYKQEIIDTRKGCLGSSDARLLAQIDSLGSVPKSAYQRLAELKGFVEHKDIPQTDAIKFGDYIENAIFDYLHTQDNKWESNLMLVSKKYSTSNVKLISHPDFWKVDAAKKTITVGECKATKYDIKTTRQTYAAQLYIHSVLAKEELMQYGEGWKMELLLCHYNTDGLDLSQEWDFDTQRLTVQRVQFQTPLFNVKRSMDIVDAFLEDFTEYYEDDEIDADLLPVAVKTQFEEIATMLTEIKEREARVDDFKKRLYEFMRDKDIRSIKNDVFTITRVDPTISKSFDAKKYLADMAKKYPRKTNKIIAEYTKETNKRGYAIIKIK